MKNNSSASIIQLLATALITAALLAGSGCAVASTPDGPPTPTFTLTPTALNFGNQPVNTISSPQSVTLTNVGSLDVVISSVNITSGVFAVSGPAAPVTVRPGNSVVYNITFRPSAAQSYSGSLSFASNAPSSPSSVSLSGTGVAGTTVLNVSPTSISFGNQVVSTTSSPRSVMAANVGSTPITISGVTTNPPFAVSGFTGSTTLNAGQSLNLSVTFTPTAQTTYTGTLTITSTAPSSPDNVALSGVGVAVGASPYTAITDRLTRPLPSPIPTLGPAGSIITDPDFGMRILRVTDANTMPDQPGQGYQTASGAATKMFNSDNTRLIVASWGNRLLAYNFNPVNMTIQRIGNPSAPSGGDLIPLVGDGAFWSYTNRDIIYGINNGKMAKYDFSTNQLAILLDPTLLSLPGMTGTRADIAGVSNDDRYITWFGGGTSQNTDMYIIRYDQQTTSWRALRIDTGEIFAGTGNNPGTSQGFATANPNGLLHNARHLGKRETPFPVRNTQGLLGTRTIDRPDQRTLRRPAPREHDLAPDLLTRRQSPEKRQRHQRGADRPSERFHRGRLLSCLISDPPHAGSRVGWRNRFG